MDSITVLNVVVDGWTRCGDLHCNPRLGGGIIDSAIVSAEWFVVFNDDRPTIEGLESLEDAIDAFAAASLSQPV